MFITCIAIDPVKLPGLAAVIRKRLLGLSRVGADPPNGKSHEDGFTVDRLLVIEVAAPILEFPDATGTQHAHSGSGEGQTPLVSGRIVRAQGQQFELTRRTIGVELRQIGTAVPHLFDHSRAVHLDPGGRAGQWLQKARRVRLPRPKIEVEIMLTISQRAIVLRADVIRSRSLKLQSTRY